MSKFILDSNNLLIYFFFTLSQSTNINMEIGSGQPNINLQPVTPTIMHLAVLLEQGRKVVRAVGVLITSHTIDFPVAVATASISELRRDSILLATFNRGWEVHTSYVQRASRQAPVVAASKATVWQQRH